MRVITPERLQVLCQNVNSTSFELKECSLSNKHIDILVQAFAQNKTVTSLDLSFNNISDAGAPP